MPPAAPRKTVLLDHTANPPASVDADVVRDFPDSALAVVESLWKPERARLPAWMDHTHWDWVRKIGLPVFEYVAVVAGAQVEGLAALARSPAPSKLSAGVDVAHLAFLETAPWNLREHPSGGRLSGVGTALLEEAVLASHAAGLGCRVLLSALPQAEDFYRRNGMTEIGLTASHGLVYFEYTEVQARDFLTRQGTTI